MTTEATLEPYDNNPELRPMALQVRQEQPVGLFGTNDPASVVEKATGVANALKGVIVKQGLVSKISGKEYPRCEAWTLLGTMLGVFPVTVWTKEVELGWEARVEARTRDGAVVGAAEAQCLRSEKNWSTRDDFALRSMAQTRATAKCLRMPLGFVMTLAGFEATPAEEMATGHPKTKVENKASAKPNGTTIHPLAERRAKLIAGLNDYQDVALEYFRKLDQPACLLPNETLESLPDWVIPTTNKQWEAMKVAIIEFRNGMPARYGFPPNTAEQPPAKPVEVPRETVETKQKDLLNGALASEPWYAVIVPIPHKGQKRDEYLKNPDTIGSLFNLRHEQTEDGAEARRRLWGFVTNFEAKGWTKTNGQVMPASEADKKFRVALDQFADWFDKNHPGE